MKLVYDKKEIAISECKSFFSRLRGFMFTKEIDHALLFNNCNSIHTFFMKTNIDVIMCSKDNKILYYYHDLKKGKIIFPKRNVFKTIELPVNYYKVKINDFVSFDDT